MNESVLELVHGIFNTFLFIMSVVFSFSLLGTVYVRSISAEALSSDSRIIYTKQNKGDYINTISGSSIIDAVRLVPHAEIIIDKSALGEELMAGVYNEEPEDIKAFYEIIDADKVYEMYYEYDDEGKCLSIVINTFG